MTGFTQAPKRFNCSWNTFAAGGQGRARRPAGRYRGVRAGAERVPIYERRRRRREYRNVIPPPFLFTFIRTNGRTNGSSVNLDRRGKGHLRTRISLRKNRLSKAAGI